MPDYIVGSVYQHSLTCTEKTAFHLCSGVTVHEAGNLATKETNVSNENIPSLNEIRL